ncbi:hypothetical protein A6R68_03642 [Neotoma lepida]|uniref:Uncharacterized protein n=1 Tax=Neotoma lepida TaxID=56216 RepID=A0A1A6GNP2_NEOLE|nr:hypothetical protein A6R68_03642 [Neotoma lepida]
MVLADPLNPCMKHIHQQQHNYAACFPPESCSQEVAPERGPQGEAPEIEAPKEKEEEEEEEEEEETVSPPTYRKQGSPVLPPQTRQY